MKAICLPLAAICLALGSCATIPAGETEFGPRGGDYPVAKKSDRPGHVISPYNDAAYIDVSGFPRGTQVEDPWTGKIFLVP